MISRVVAVAGVAVLAALPLLTSGAAPLTPEQVEREADRGAAVLRIKNSSPFILQIYVSNVRAGWIKPFRTEVFKGLKSGYHRIYSHSEYGSASWGPRNVYVPGTLNIAIETQTSDLDTALASRVFQANKASLVACGKLAEKRGEEIRGNRVEFEVAVSGKGAGKVSVKGDGLGDQLLSCYRAVVTQWKFPVTGSDYTISFTHTP